MAVCSSNQRLQGGRVQVGQPTKAAIGGNTLQLRAGIIQPARNTLCLLVVDERGDMIGKRRALVVDYGIFGSGQDFTLNQHSPTFQLAEYRTGGRFIPAAGGHFLDNPRTVPILRGVGPGGNHNPVAAVLPDGDGCRPAFLFRVDPLGKALPLTDDDLRPGRQRLGCGFLEYCAHVSPFAI